MSRRKFVLNIGQVQRRAGRRQADAPTMDGAWSRTGVNSQSSGQAHARFTQRSWHSTHSSSIVGTLLGRVLPDAPTSVSSILAARLRRCAHNCAPRLLVFLICALLIFLVYPYSGTSAGAAHRSSVQAPAGGHLNALGGGRGHLSGPALASHVSAGAGHISGQLLDGSRHNAPLANQSVTLQMAQNNTSRDLLSLTTDAQGRYAFGGLQSDSSVQYAIYTLYQGAQYVTDLIDLSKKADQQVNLTVYDATTSTANLAVVQTSILIDKPNPQSGLLTVSEDFFFENLGLTTYVGKLDASHGKPNALLFSLPPGARFLSLAAGFDGYNTVQVDSGFASNAAVPPGTSEFSFSFQVPYSGTGYHFTYKAIYPTLSLTLLTPTNILTTPQGLTSKGPTNTKSGTYQMFQTKTLKANDSVGAQLDGLPARVKTTPQQSSLNSGLLWLVALLIVLIVLAGIGGYIYNTRKRRAARVRQRQKPEVRKHPVPSPGKKAATTKDALLRELLELDKAYEAGKLKKAAYQDQRARLKARLRKLIGEEADQSAEPTGKAARSSGKGTK